MKRVSLILQEILRFLLIFMFFFIWIRYFLRKFYLAVLVSILCAAVVQAVWWVFQHKKTAKNGLKIKEKEEAENMFLSLACSDNPMDFFARLALKKHPNVTKHKAYIVIEHKEEGTKTLLYGDFSFAELNTARFMEIYSKIKKEKANKIVICCHSAAEKEVIAFCQNFKEKFLIFDQYKTYQNLYKYYDCYPEITKKYNPSKKMAFKDFVAYSFNKQRAKGYLFSAFVLILSGLFVRYSIYYCIVASLLVVCALLSQFNPYFNVKTESEVL